MCPEDPSPDRDSLPPEIPGEKTLLAELRAFQPAPGQRFYERMADAPWNAAGNSPIRGRDRWRRGFAAAALLIATLVLLALASPPAWRATAQRLADLFIHSSSNRTSVEITPVSPGQLDYDFDQTIPEAAAAAGFPVKAPRTVPPYLQFSGAEYVPRLGIVFLDYRSEDSRQILRISQQQVGGVERYASIGPNAEVETVKIGDAIGEYVNGGWRLPILATPLEAAAPGVKITLEADWESEGQIQILRWQAGDMLYEILSVAAPSARDTYLVKADLLTLAEGME